MARQQAKPHARVWFTRDTVHYAVYSHGDLVFYDNTGKQAWRKTFDEALARVETLRHGEMNGNLTTKPQYHGAPWSAYSEKLSRRGPRH